MFSGFLEYRCRLTDKPLADQSWPLLKDHERICNSENCPAGSYCRGPIDYNVSFDDREVQNSGNYLTKIVFKNISDMV